MHNLFFCFVLFCSVLSASAENSAEQNSKTLEESKVSTSPKQNVNKRGKVKPLKEFIPSEEVSPDKPVAFPNDI